MELKYVLLTIIKILISVPLILIQTQLVQTASLMGGHVSNDNLSQTESSLSANLTQIGNNTNQSTLDVTTSVEEIPDPSALVLPGYNLPENIFNKGKPFYLEKDPLTGEIDFDAKARLDDDLYDYVEDAPAASDSIYDKANINRKDGHKPSDVNQLTPNFHDFLNLPIKYNSEKYVYPLISSSYANTKIQGNVNKLNNHKNYNLKSITTNKPTNSPTYYYNSQKTSELPISESTTMGGKFGHPMIHEEFEYYDEGGYEEGSYEVVNKKNNFDNKQPTYETGYQKPVEMVNKPSSYEVGTQKPSFDSFDKQPSYETGKKPASYEIASKKPDFDEELSYETVNKPSSYDVVNQKPIIDSFDKQPSYAIDKKPLSYDEVGSQKPSVDKEPSYEMVKKPSSDVGSQKPSVDKEPSYEMVKKPSNDVGSQKPSVDTQPSYEMVKKPSSDVGSFDKQPSYETVVESTGYETVNKPSYDVVSKKPTFDKQQPVKETEIYLTTSHPNPNQIYLTTKASTKRPMSLFEQLFGDYDEPVSRTSAPNLNSTQATAAPSEYDDEYQANAESTPKPNQIRFPTDPTTKPQPVTSLPLGENHVTAISRQPIILATHNIHVQLNDEKVHKLDANEPPSTSNVHIAPDQDTVSFVVGHHQAVAGGGQYVGTALKDAPPESNPFRPLHRPPNSTTEEVLQLSSQPVYHQLPSDLTPPRPPWDPRPGHFHAGRPEYARPPRPADRADRLPNILPQFRPPPPQHRPLGRQPLLERPHNRPVAFFERLRPPPVPQRPADDRIVNDAPTPPYPFYQTPPAGDVATLQMIQAKRAEPQSGGQKPVYVVYPINANSVKVDVSDQAMVKLKDSVVIGTRAELPLPPPSLIIDFDQNPILNPKDRNDAPILKPHQRPTNPSIGPFSGGGGGGVKSDFPYLLERPEPIQVPDVRNVVDEIDYVSNNQWNTLEVRPQSNLISATLRTYTERPIAVAYTPTESQNDRYSLPNYNGAVIPEIRRGTVENAAVNVSNEFTVSAIMRTHPEREQGGYRRGVVEGGDVGDVNGGVNLGGGGVNMGGGGVGGVNMGGGGVGGVNMEGGGVNMGGDGVGGVNMGVGVNSISGVNVRVGGGGGVNVGGGDGLGEFQAPFQASVSVDGAQQGWAVVRRTNTNRTKEEEELEVTTVGVGGSSSEFDIENFKPELIGGFKPIYTNGEGKNGGGEREE